MGELSHDPFDNDDGLDFVSELVECDNLSCIETAIDRFFADANCVYFAIAAIQVLAILLGRGTTYDPVVKLWVKANPQRPSAELIDKAQFCMQLIMEPGSQYLESWESRKSGKEWKSFMQKLTREIGA